MSNDSYWAATPSADFGNELWARLDSNRRLQQTSPVSGLQSLAYSYVYDAAIRGDTNSAMVIRGGSEGELANTRINGARSLLTALVQIITAPAISWSCSALNSDPESTSATVTGAMILEHQWKTRGVSRTCVEAAEKAHWAGESFLFTPWDKSLGDFVAVAGGKPVKSGDIAYEIVPSWNVTRDGKARSFAECKWFGVRVPRNRWDLVAMYPDKREEILAAQTNALDENNPWARIQRGQDSAETDQVMATFWFHDRTPALPHGRQTVSLGANAVLEDGVLSYKRIPIHRLASGNLDGTPWGYAAGFLSTLGLQEISDAVATSLATNITTFGSPIISAEVGSDLPVDQLGGGLSVLYRPSGTQPPVPISFATPSSESFKFLTVLQQAQRQMVGLNDVSLGQPETAQFNASAFAILYAAALQQNSGHQRNWIEFCREVGQSVLEIYRDFCPQPRLISIVGDGNKNVLQPSVSFKGQDLEQIDKVQAEIGNALAQSPSGRLELAKAFQAAGFVTTPEVYTAILDTGRLDPQLQSHRNQLILISAENKDLRAGTPAIVSVYDNHPLHVPEHAAELAKPSVRSNPAAVKAIQDHITQHHDALYNTDPSLLALAGIQPPPPPAAPPPGPDAQPPPMDAPVSQGPGLKLPDDQVGNVQGAPDPASILGNLPGVIAPKK